VVQPAETPQQVTALTDKLNDLEQTLVKANGQNELLGHELDQSKQDLAATKTRLQSLEDRLTTLDARLAAAEKASSELSLQVNGPPPGAPVAEAPPAGDPAAESFDQAYALLKGGETAKAQTAFSDFVTRYGDSAKGPEGRYWLGETLYVGKSYSDAATAYIGAIRGWPSTPWAPDATLKLARSLLALGRAPDACRTLDELGRRYPKAPAPIPTRAAVTRASAQCVK
jgi:tol-pal system protein YbgF